MAFSPWREIILVYKNFLMLYNYSKRILEGTSSGAQKNWIINGNPRKVGAIQMNLEKLNELISDLSST